MTDEALVERLAGVLREHAYVPSGLRGVSKCGCGVQMHGMPHDHRAHVAAELASVVREVEADRDHWKATCVTWSAEYEKAWNAGYEAGIDHADNTRGE